MKPMRLPLTTIALFVTLAVAPALAQTYYAIMGAGLELCGAWTEARQQNKAEVPEHWLLGYLSGIASESVSGTDPLNGMDAEAVFAWVDNYCRAHPLDTIERAGGSFARQHRR
jgi:hypothetical protein